MYLFFWNCPFCERMEGWYGTLHNDILASISEYLNKLYLLYQPYTVDTETPLDIYLQIIDMRTGAELSTKTYTGSSVSKPINIVANHLGVFMLADIEDGFKDNDSVDTYATQNSNTNFAIDLDGLTMEKLLR